MTTKNALVLNTNQSIKQLYDIVHVTNSKDIMLSVLDCDLAF